MPIRCREEGERDDHRATQPHADATHPGPIVHGRAVVGRAPKLRTVRQRAAQGAWGGAVGVAGVKVHYKTTWNVRRDKRVWRARLRGYNLCITTVSYTHLRAHETPEHL